MPFKTRHRASANSLDLRISLFHFFSFFSFSLLGPVCPSQERERRNGLAGGGGTPHHHGEQLSSLSSHWSDVWYLGEANCGCCASASSTHWWTAPASKSQRRWWIWTRVCSAAVPRGSAGSRQLVMPCCGCLSSRSAEAIGARRRDLQRLLVHHQIGQSGNGVTRGSCSVLTGGGACSKRLRRR
ncbi:hypothetical protein SEVIR_4G084801v4 [Setaria viridis]|uniref:Uncharacterized protein n=1 Tax=Setaria viridis TaxID=4556 RepID=A0A4U6UX13_SETVI|nr:hypothetical protein SEVIR_4G084801v2 [Setaria viridis]